MVIVVTLMVAFSCRLDNEHALTGFRRPVGFTGADELYRNIFDERVQPFRRIFHPGLLGDFMAEDDLALVFAQKRGFHGVFRSIDRAAGRSEEHTSETQSP